MHLTDEELLAPTEAQQVHLAGCNLCSQRYENLMAMREQLQAIPSKQMPNRNWAEVFAHYQPPESTDNKVVKLNAKPSDKKFWYLAMPSMAASLLAVALLVNVYMNHQARPTEIEGQIAILINQTNMLQAQLLEAGGSQAGRSVQLASVRYQMNQIDSTIQTAYLANESEQVILALWQSKVSLLQRLVEQSTQTKVLKV